MRRRGYGLFIKIILWACGIIDSIYMCETEHRVKRRKKEDL